MSYKIEILEPHDYVTKDLMCRPIADYSGMFERPQNWYDWACVTKHLGECWLDGTYKVKDLLYVEIPLEYEFMRYID